MNNFKNVLFHLFFENVISVCVCLRVRAHACVCILVHVYVKLRGGGENLVTTVKEPPSTKVTGSCSRAWF